MRRVGVVLGLVVIAATSSGLWATPAHAMEIPPVSSMDSATKATVKTRILTWPSTPGDDLLTGMWRARTAAAVEPAVGATGAPLVGTMGTIALAAGTGYVAYKITDAIAGGFLYRKFAGTDPVPTGTITASGWSTWGGSTGCDAVAGSGVECWFLQTNSTTDTGIIQYCTASPVNSTTCPNTNSQLASRITYHTAVSGTAFNNGGAGYPCGGCSVKIRTHTQLANSLRVQPMTASEWAAAPSAQRVTAPSPTATTLTDAQAQSALDRIHADDDTAQDASDAAAATHIGTGLGFDTFSAPNLLGVLPAAAASTLALLGHTGTITYTTATTATANPAYPAGSIIVQPWTVGDTIEKTGAITFTKNPAASLMPFTLPAPLYGETADDYRTRLITAGLLGTATITTLTEDTAVPQLGRSTTVRVRIGTTTLTVPVPTTTPFPASGTAVSPWSSPTIAAGTDVEIEANPDTLPDYGDVPGSGSSDCPCPIPAVDFSPLSEISTGTTFPFGLFTFMGDVLDHFNVTPEPPGWSFNLGTDAVGHYDYDWDLAAFSPYMAIVRSLISVALWIGAVWLLATRLLGFNAGGDLTEAADDGSVI